MAKVRGIGLDEVFRQFEEPEDPSSEVNLRHPFVSLVVFALPAVLAGAGGPTAIARSAVLRQEFLLPMLAFSRMQSPEHASQIAAAVPQRLPLPGTDGEGSAWWSIRSSANLV